MRHLRYIIALVVLATGCFAFGASAQRMQNGSYSTTGYIKSDGTVQDGSYRTIGHIKSDGTVQDGSYRTIGHVKSDGTVQDGSYRTIGHASGVSKEWAACFFLTMKRTTKKSTAAPRRPMMIIDNW